MAKQSLDDVIIRFTATHAHFTRPTNEVTVTCRLRCSVKWEQIFNEYKMDGYSTEENEMYLRVKIDHLKNAVAHIEKSTIVSLKLDNGSSDQGPVLLIILETGLSTVCNKRIVKQQVPIVVVSHRRWVDYIEDPLPSYKVSIELKNPKLLSKIVDRLKLMDNSVNLVAIRNLDSVVQVNKSGTLRLVSAKNMSGAIVSSEFPNAPMVIHDIDDDSDDGENDGDDESDRESKQFNCSVTVDVRLLQQYLSSFATQSSTLHINLRKGEYATFNLQQHEMDVTLTLPNQCGN